MSLYKNHINSTPIPLPNGIRDTLLVNSHYGHPRRSATPIGRPIPANAAHLMNSIEGDLGADEDPRLAVFRGLYATSEARLNTLFEGRDGDQIRKRKRGEEQEIEQNEDAIEEAPAQAGPPSKKAIRSIDEDDYDESDDEEEDDSSNVSPLKSRSTVPGVNVTLSSSAMLREVSSSSMPASAKGATPSVAGKTTEEARRKLEDDKKATEDAAKRSFHTLFYTVENDRDAMLEQKKLEETERQVDVEMGGHGNDADGIAGGNAQQGTLSQSNLGASSLTLKNLIRQIDAKRDRVHATDMELRALMSEVRKNRSKWASEDKVGQEELYEAAEKVLNELRAMTEHSGPFLSRVAKKDAPDYYNVIKTPMDLSQMQKKLRGTQYKSKAEFVSDLSLIWNNCLKYNANPEHFLRKKALAMRKETEKLVPLIPNITIKDRAVVEAEERQQNGGHTLVDDDEDSDDEPLISSRGRKAPGKTSKKGTTARKAPAGVTEDSPAPSAEPKLNHHLANGLGSNLKNEALLRAESESNLDGSQKDASTPPPGTITPAGFNGTLGHSTQIDAMDIDGESSINGIVPSLDGPHEEVENDDPDYKIWKQVTKKDRATVTAERHALFLGDHLDPEQPALRRTKQGMRRWLRNQKQAINNGALGKKNAEAEVIENVDSQPRGETLAEGMEGEEERVLPDYYDTMAAIPDLPDRLRWIEDSEGNVADPSEEFLRIVPKGLFISPDSNLTRKIDENLRQIQNTRKVTSKVGVVKQMQQQSQMYQGQFQKHEAVPFVEQDAESHVISDEGPTMAPWVTRAALQRSTAKILVHAGFEEYQPAALEAFTDLTADYFTKLARTLNEYTQAPKVPVPSPDGELTFKEMFTNEEKILHALQVNGVDLDGLDSYVTEDVERAGSRITATHDRMKAFLAESLRPALVDAGPDGSNAFNDNSEQFVSGDFAEELGEDFFGFKDLGLDIGFSVPLHLLQNRIRNTNQAQNPSALSAMPLSDLPTPAPLTPITMTTVTRQIGLVQNFFLAKLHANNEQPLVEDDDLPQKQRFPKPRLPPTGKITSPRKRPPKEPGPGKGHPRKKMKLNDGEAKETGKDNEGAREVEKEKEQAKDDMPGASKPTTNGVTTHNSEELGREATGTPTPIVKRADGDAPGTPIAKGKQKGDDGGMISPESLEAI
ncbi:transcriptional activator SPT7, partial [Lecanoromycetidae sp. Uapishka_2]